MLTQKYIKTQIQHDLNLMDVRWTLKEFFSFLCYFSANAHNVALDFKVNLTSFGR